MGRMESRCVLVTGGASGIGEATVRAIVREGGSAVIADLQDERGSALAEELGDAVAIRHTDVTREEDMAAAVALAVARFGGLYGLVNSAGVVGAVGSIMETSVEAFDRTVAIHCRGTFLGIKHAARAMRAAGRGSIVSLASTAGVMGGLGPHVYTMAKHGIVGLTKSASAELAPLGIRVNAVAPGGTVTPMTIALGDNSVESAVEFITSGSPLGIPCLPEDIANAILFLLSDDARQMSGHTLVIDAGVTTSNQAAAALFFSRPAGTLLHAGQRAGG